MRALSTEELRLLRSDQWGRYARTKAASGHKAATGQRLKSAQRVRFVDVVAPILRRAEPTPFALEGALRHWLRGRFCLKGWNWADADRAADEIIVAGLNRIGAERPTWKQGQPEYTQDGVMMVERVTCVNCGSPLPKQHTKYCSQTCSTNYTSRLYYLSRQREEAALHEVSDGLA